ADEDGVEHGERRDLAGTSGVDRDLLHGGGALFGRILEGYRPARRLAGRPHLVAQGIAVDFDDHAVDLVVDVVPLALPLRAVGEYLVQRRGPLDGRIHRQAGGSQAVQVLAVALRSQGGAGAGADAVDPELQGARRRDRGVFLAQAAGGGVARIGEPSFALV